MSVCVCVCVHIPRGSPRRLGRHRELGWGGAAGGGGRLLAGVGEGFPVVLSGVAMAAGNAHCVRSWVPKGRHPVGAAEGYGPQVNTVSHELPSTSRRTRKANALVQYKSESFRTRGVNDISPISSPKAQEGGRVQGGTTL